MGPPFQTRRRHQAGLIFPDVAEWPNFTCEACTVRAVLNRELFVRGDQRLLRLERMRLIDIASHWAPSTLKQYKYKLAFL